MNARTFPLAVAALTILFAIASAPAFAQATRTWVAVDGDDSGPCSPTQPCQTFAGAISKTAAGGEIDCLGIGGFGPVTITKSITIDCSATFGGILAGASNGVIVNAGANDVVRLRGLSIQGTNTGVSGIRVLAARAVLIDGCTIGNFVTSGVDVTSSTASTTVVISNTSIENSGNGVRVAPTGTARAIVTLDRVTLAHDTVGFAFSTAQTTGDIVAVLRDSVVVANAFGVQATGTVNLMIDNVSISNNVTGISVNGATTVARVARSTIVGNGTGVDVIAGGQALSTGDNVVAGNTGSDVFTGPVPVQ